MRIRNELPETRPATTRPWTAQPVAGGVASHGPPKGGEPMFHSTLRRSFLVFALTLVLASSAASAAVPRWSFDTDLGRAVHGLLGCALSFQQFEAPPRA